MALGAAAVLLLVCCVGGAVLGFNAISNANDFRTGKCVERQDASGGDRAVPVDCSDPDAYRILRRVDNTTRTDDTSDCPPTTTYTFVNFEDRYVLCLREAS